MIDNPVKYRVGSLENTGLSPNGLKAVKYRVGSLENNLVLLVN